MMKIQGMEDQTHWTLAKEEPNKDISQQINAICDIIHQKVYEINQEEGQHHRAESLDEPKTRMKGSKSTDNLKRRERLMHIDPHRQRSPNLENEERIGIIDPDLDSVRKG